MTMSQLVQIMRTLRTMPPLPNVAHRVLQIVRDPEYSIDTLVKVVRTDPALTSRILKLCNSSLYGLSQDITDVGNAVAYLGMRNLVRLVLVSCTASYFKSAGNSPYGNPDELWRHTMACATACQMLAEQCGYEQPATAFTAGIVHNVGKIALAQSLDPKALPPAVESVDSAGRPYLQIEREFLGLDHAAAGGIVTENWNLPVEIRRAVRNHHDPSRLSTDSELTALLHVADLLVLQLDIGVAFRDADYGIEMDALLRLHLAEEDLEPLQVNVLEELRRSTELLNLED
ncbi:MAG: HDOD domain-containing protein [Planctomycetota bacterium]